MIRLSAGLRVLPFFQSIHTDFGTHLACNSMGTGNFSPEVNRSGLEADHFLPCSAEVKNEWRYKCTLYVLQGFHKRNKILTVSLNQGQGFFH